MTRQAMPQQYKLLLGLLLTATLASCGRSAELEPQPVSSASESTEVADPPAPPPAEPDDQEISAYGIGPAQLGLTLGELKQLLGSDASFVTQSPFLAEFDAIAVRQDGEILFHILYLAGESLGDGDVIQGVLTTNSAFETDEGIGVGTPIADAEATYGSATLSHHEANASLEYVRFDAPPADNISFGTWARQPGETTPDYAGVYAQDGSDYRETTEYDPDATIKSVLVVCLTETCAS
ncbi:MAG: hypothetical protein ACFB5Z_07820 [Elainellaceae cyanobacterium]